MTEKPTTIQLTPAEVQSGLDRVRYAELLINQLPLNHDGANTWLLNYGIGERAQRLQAKRKGVDTYGKEDVLRQQQERTEV